MNTSDYPQAEPDPIYYDEPADYWRDVEAWRAAMEEMQA